MLKIKKSKTTPYHPNSDGLIERLFRTAKEMLRACMVHRDFYDWCEAIPSIEMSLRATIQRTIQLSPYECLFGRKMRTPLSEENQINREIKKQFQSETQYVQMLEKELKEIHSFAQANIQKNSMKMKNIVKKEAKKFDVGELVMSKVFPLNTKQKNIRYEGPYIVKKKIAGDSYLLE